MHNAKVISRVLNGKEGVREIALSPLKIDSKDKKRERDDQDKESTMLNDEDKELIEKFRAVRDSEIKALLTIAKSRRTEDAKALTSSSARAEKAEKEAKEMKSSLEVAFSSISDLGKKLERAEAGVELQRLKAKEAFEKLDALQKEAEKAHLCQSCSTTLWVISNAPCGCRMCSRCAGNSVCVMQCSNCKNPLTSATFLQQGK